MSGFLAYHAVPTNFRALNALEYHVTTLWLRSLRRRSLPRVRICAGAPSNGCPYRDSSVRGVPGNRHPYRDRQLLYIKQRPCKVIGNRSNWHGSVGFFTATPTASSIHDLSVGALVSTVRLASSAVVNESSLRYDLVSLAGFDSDQVSLRNLIEWGRGSSC